MMPPDDGRHVHRRGRRIFYRVHMTWHLPRQRGAMVRFLLLFAQDLDSSFFLFTLDN